MYHVNYKLRFQDDDDIFGLNDDPPKVTTPAKSETPAKKPEPPASLDFLEMATGSKSQAASSSKLLDSPDSKTVKKPEPKPVNTPTSTSSKKAADWLGLKDDSEDEDFDSVLKARGIIPQTVRAYFISACSKFSKLRMFPF